MNHKTVLKVMMTMATIFTAAVSAGAGELYKDPATGLIYADSAAGRVGVQAGADWADRLKFGFNVRGYGQALSQKNSDNSLKDLDASIGRGFGNIDVWAKVVDGIDIYVELYISSRQHAEMYGHEGYMWISKTPPYLSELDLPALDSFFENFSIKAGHFEIDYGDAHLYRTDNGEVQRNPLVGNFIVDPNTDEAGFEIRTKPGRPYGMTMGFTNGSENERFTTDQGIALYGKIYAEPQESIRLSLSAYTVDHSESNATSGNASSALFSGNRSGGPYAAVIGPTSEPGQIAPGSGEEVFAWQTDVRLDMGRTIARGHYGVIKDEDAVRAREGWKYYSAEVQYDLLPERSYLAARYSRADADEINSVASSGRIGRAQVGGGIWLTKDILAKLEYVDQRFKKFAAGTTVDGIAAGKDPKFSGLSLEFSAKF